MNMYEELKENEKINSLHKELLTILTEGSNENTNKDSTLLSTQRDLMAGIISKDFAVKYMLPEHIVDAHKKGIIHIHDLDYYANQMINCCLVNLKEMLSNGTCINGKLIEPPTNLRTACTVATQIIAQVASSQYGGQTVSIAHLAPFVGKSKEKLFERFKGLPINSGHLAKIVYDELRCEIRDSVQTILYQINTLQTANGQTPFVSLILNVREDKEFEEETAMLVEEIMYQFKQGLKNEDGVFVTPTFPKLIYVLNDENYTEGTKYWYLTKLACETVSKRMMPDFLSEKNIKNLYGDLVYPMGCRAFLPPYEKDGKFLWWGRFNMGVTSINLPYIAVKAKGDIDSFWKHLEEVLCLAKESLYLRVCKLRGVKAKTSPIHWVNGALARLDPEDTIDELLQGGYATVSLGYMGLFEAIKVLTGNNHIEEVQLCEKIMQKLAETIKKWRAETGIGFALYATPAESLTDKFCKAIESEFGSIKDITDKGYLTNSYHVDIRQKIDAFSKLEFESAFPKYSAGGHISYIEVDDLSKNPEAIEGIVKYMYEKCYYAEINSKFDYCYECKFEGQLKINDDNKFECPVCGNTDSNRLYHVRRTCGYLGSKEANYGRMQDFKNRVTHL